MEDAVQPDNVNFVPCVRWVKKGVANTNPTKIQLSKDELVQIIKETKEKLNVGEGDDEDDEDAPMEAQTSGPDEFNLEQYDNDVDDTANALGIQSLAELPADDQTENFDDSDDSDKEDDIIKTSDNLILVGHVEGDASVLEVYVYNEEEQSLYVHHDIFLPSIPLCLEWLDYEPGSPKGSYCAIGSMSPIIEVWDLDVMNIIEPAYTLGTAGSRKKNKPQVGHTDAVLALAWNRYFDHIIASGSVDQTVLLWDMEKQVPSTKLTSFAEKVQCLDWHKREAQTLLAGGCDCTAKVFDCRSPDQHQSWDLDGEAEKLIWNPLQPYMFLAGTSTGKIQAFDCRSGLLWSVEAHAKEVTGLVVSGQCPGLMITASPDETLKTWDFSEEGAPRLVHEKEFNIGNVHCLDLSPDLPFVISAGGDKKSNNFLVYDVQNLDVVKHHFGSRPLVALPAEDSEAPSSSS